MKRGTLSRREFLTGAVEVGAMFLLPGFPAVHRPETEGDLPVFPVDERAAEVRAIKVG